MASDPPPFNAVELEVFRQLLAAVAEEMGQRLMRCAYSPNIKERRDYSCAVFDRRGDMIAQAAHIPVHLGSAPASVKAILASFPAESMRPGERFIVNDPYAGGTHLPDVTVLAPCFCADEPLPRFFVANRAHHADVGGVTPGSMPISTSIDQEGVRLPPQRLTQAVMQAFSQQTRTPAERLGDLQAQLASLDAGLQRLTSLADDHGADRVEAAGEALQQYAQRFVTSLVAGFVATDCRFEDVLDDDGHGRLDPTIRGRLLVEGQRMTFDFRETDDQVLGPINAVRSIVESAVLYALRCLAPAELPSNSGLLRPVTILTRPGSLLDARYPAAVAAGNVETSQRVVDVVFGLLAQVLPDRIPAASCGSMNNLLIGSVDGDPQPFAYYETIAGGAGAGPHQPGGHAIHTHMTNTLNTPVEALEHAYPFRVTAYRRRRGSGGRGLHRGGDGVVRQYTFDRPAVVTLLTERRRHPPPGRAGGEPGVTGLNQLIDPRGQAHTLPAKCTLTVNPGDVLRLSTPGGGGWGPAPPDATDSP